jgi:hypothetical protein
MQMTGSRFDPRRLAVVGILAGLLTLAIAAGGAAPARAATTCSWGGNALAPTGWFTVNPGTTATPMPEPAVFVATGQLAGDDPRCRGEMKFVGQVDAGSTCALSSFEGQVKGLPGVARFWGKGNLLVPSQLYDKAGNLVGIENANINTQYNSSHFSTACATPEGFTGPANFSSVVELYK